MKGILIINQKASKKTGKEYRAVWFSPADGKPDRLVTLDWFKCACIFGVFDEIKQGKYPVFLADISADDKEF